MSETIRSLSDGEPFDPRGILRGAWSNFQMRRLVSGETIALTSDRAEHAFYVLSGNGSARSHGDTFAVREGMAVTIPQGDEIEVEAGAEDLEMFVCTLDLQG